MAKVKRPLPARVAEVRARVARGPREDGRWYWRAWTTTAGTETPRGGGWWHVHEVERWLLKLATEPADGPRGRTNTVTDLLEFWMGDQELRADLSPKTVEARRAAAKHVKRGIGAVLVGEVDRTVLDRYRDRRLREPVCVRRKKRVDGHTIEEWEDIETGRNAAPRTVHYEILVLRMAWRWGREIGIVTGELPRCIVRVKGWVRNRYTPTATETAAVWRKLEGWAQLALLLYAGTGARLDEIAGLVWGGVDLDAAELHVTGKQGARVVPIEPPVVAALRTAGPGPAGVRVLTCAYSTARAIYRRLEVACRAAGVPRFAPGGLRRAAVIALYRSGEDISVAGAIIGHSPEVAMRHYREIEGEEKHAAMRGARLGHLPDLDAKVVELTPARRKRS